jgi:hypothetical protein
MNRERTNAALNEELQKLSSEFQAQQEEFQQVEKAANKQVRHFSSRCEMETTLSRSFQLSIKQDQLIRYDQSLHEADIKSKYAKEECLIQEKEIVRLNTIQEEHENKIKTLQQDLIKLQDEVRRLLDESSVTLFFRKRRCLCNWNEARLIFAL